MKSEMSEEIKVQNPRKQVKMVSMLPLWTCAIMPGLGHMEFLILLPEPPKFWDMDVCHHA